MIAKLKSEVELKFGRKIAYQKDCNLLSDSIFESTNEYLSAATLRRVFGFLSTNSNPSRVTLDILSHYVGYKDWEDFNTTRTKIGLEPQYSAIDSWNTILTNAEIISHNTVEHIKIKSGIDFEKTVKRPFLKDRLKLFINSNYPATALIAPGGYGKSTALAKWYLNRQNKKNKNKDVILFISAQMLDQFAPTDFFLEAWFMRLLGLKADSNFLNDIPLNNFSVPGKFIIIIDALDEIASQGSRQEKIFKSIIDTVGKLSKMNSFKLIVTTRDATWKLFSSFIRDSEHWFFTNSDIFTNDGANIPQLSFEEIQTILDNTLNERYSTRTLVHEMHPDLKGILSYPYFLQLFIQTYTPETQHLLNDQMAILSEFLKKQVYFSHFSDEKIDILNQIIILSEYGTKHVLKNNLKRVYPIHLKLSGNYFAAYEELISFGIIQEETQVDIFGGYSRYIKIANQQLMCMLIVQNLIRKEQGVHFNLFRWIDNNLIDTELQAKVLGILFKLAYKERLVEPLLDFFKLSPTALASTLATPTITTTLRTDNYMRSKLIPHYAQQPIARNLLFEKNIDYNHIVDSFSFFLKTYLDYTSTNTGKHIANTLLSLAGFLSMNAPMAIFHLNATKSANTKEMSASIAGVWFSNQLFYESLMGNGNPDSCIEKAAAFAESLADNEEKETFAESILPNIALLSKFEYIPRFIELQDSLTAPNHRAATFYLATKFYRHRCENKGISGSDSSTIQQLYSLLNPLRSYQGIILGEVLRTIHYFSKNEMETSQNCYRNAVELSGIAGYKLIEATLMKHLSQNLIKLGEADKANSCMAYVNSLWKLSGFKHELP